MVISGPNPRVVPLAHSVDFIENNDLRVTWEKTGTAGSGGNSLVCEFKGPEENRFYYVGFGAVSDAERYTDADAVYAAAASGVEWPTLTPQMRGA